VARERTVEDLQNQLATSKREADEEKAKLNQAINSLHSDLHVRDKRKYVHHRTHSRFLFILFPLPESEIARLEKTIQELSTQLAESHHKADSQMRLIRTQEKSISAKPCVPKVIYTMPQDIPSISQVP
jgi:uncharacterized coiled-coil protein SlyX